MASDDKTHAGWSWWICVLLLLATMINYMDRQALTVISPRLKSEFPLNNEEYGKLETGYGLAFAVGLIVLGACADRTSVIWFYPLILACWSFMGFLTGYAQDFRSLLICRTLLGFFEGGNWPCGITVIQRLLPPSNRSLGNGLLQGGGALGAIATPLIMAMFLTEQAGSWRPVFQAIGVSGAFWIVLWLWSMRGYSMPASHALPARTDPDHASQAPSESFLSVLLSRRFFVVLAVSLGCNTCWHFVRVWMPLFLRDGDRVSEKEMFTINAGYFISADLGCWLAGAATMWLAQRGSSLHAARWQVYLTCCLLTSLSVLLLFVSQTWLIILVLLLVGAGSLGLFPTFYALSQALSNRHQGVTIGILGALPWFVLSYLHPLFGSWLDKTGAYKLGFALIGLVPLASFLFLWLGWPDPKRSAGTLGE